MPRPQVPWADVRLGQQVLLNGFVWRVDGVPPAFSATRLSGSQPGHVQATSHGGWPKGQAVIIPPGDPDYVVTEQERLDSSPPPGVSTPDELREWSEALVMVRLGGQPVARQETPGGPWIVEPGELTRPEWVIRHLMLFHGFYASSGLMERSLEDLLEQHASRSGIVANIAHTHREGP